jgi:hypothetical protein
MKAFQCHSPLPNLGIFGFVRVPFPRVRSF